MPRSIRLVVLALAAALALTACGGKDKTAAPPNASTPTVVADGTLAAGNKIAAPKGEVVLTVSGDIGEVNKGKKLELDLASLEKMRQVKLEAAEPFLKRRVTLGCRDGQGFHFARPLPAAAMTELLGKSLADGGFYLPATAQPVESLSG